MTGETMHPGSDDPMAQKDIQNQQEELPYSPSDRKNEIEINSENILNDPKYIFHGVGFDTLSLRKILQHGLLSEQASKDMDVKISKNNIGYNLSRYISFSESPATSGMNRKGSFGTYSLKGISLIVDRTKNIAIKASKGSRMDSGFPDEVYVATRVAPEDIKGVMINSNFLNRRISELSYGVEKMGTGLIAGRCLQTIQELSDDFGYNEDVSILKRLLGELDSATLKNFPSFVEYDKQVNKLRSEINSFMQSYIESAYNYYLEQEETTLRDVMKHDLPEGMKIYDTDGEEQPL